MHVSVAVDDVLRPHRLTALTHGHHRRRSLIVGAKAGGHRRHQRLVGFHNVSEYIVLLVDVGDGQREVVDASDGAEEAARIRVEVSTDVRDDGTEYNHVSDVIVRMLIGVDRETNDF